MILLTGATGRIGTALVSQLQARRMPFRALAHTPASYERLSARNVEAVLDNLTSGENLATAFEGVERLFLLTPSSPSLPDTERRLVDAASAAGVHHIVKLSVLAADADVALVQPHFASEQYIRQSGIGATFLRPNAFMQNLAIEAAAIKQHGALFNSVGDGPVSFIHTDDIAAVAAAVLSDERHIGQTYDLTGPEALTYAEVSAKLSELLGRPVGYVALDDDANRELLQSVGMPPWYANALTELYRFYREGKAQVVNDLVGQLTGRPARSFDTYLNEQRALFA